MCDLFLTYHTEHKLIFLSYYCNNRISVNNCNLEAPNFFIICIILLIVQCIVQTCFMNSLYNSIQLLVQRLLISEPNFVLILLHQQVLQLCQVFVLLCQLKNKKLVLTICFPSCLQDLISHL